MFLRVPEEQLAAARITNIQIKGIPINNHTIRHMLSNIDNNKQNICNFYVVPGKRQALLGMSYIEMLNILNINDNTLGTKEQIELLVVVQTQPSQDVSNTI